MSDESSAHATPNAAGPRTRPTRADYVAWRTATTRWRDDDAYGHLNNATYYELFDTAVNAFLYEATGVDVRALPQIGVVAETGCRYFREIGFPEPIEMGLVVDKVGTSSIVYRIGLFQGPSDEAAAEGRFEDTGYRVRKDGSRFWADMVLTALHAPGGALRGFSLVMKDLTSLRQAEEERGRLVEQLAEEERLAAERRAEEERIAAEKLAEERRRAEEEHLAAEETRRLAEERAAEERRLAEQKRADEERRIAEEKHRADLERQAAERLKGAGVRLVEFKGADEAALLRVAEEVATDWATDLDKRGKPGTAALEAYREALEKGR